MIKEYLEKHGFERFEPKVVLFDMDGTIYDSMPNHVVCWAKATAKFGIPLGKDEIYQYEGMTGAATVQLLGRKYLSKDIPEDEARQVYEEKARLFETMPLAPIMPGVKQLMQKLKDRGLRIGIVTGSGQRPLIERAKRDFAGLVEPELVISAYDYKKGKPDPEPYLMGLKKAGNLQPWQGIVVENAPLGIRSGVAARCFTIGVNTGPLTREILAADHPDVIYDSMPEAFEQFDI